MGRLAEGEGQRSISILGATGSIGASTVDLLKRHRERFRVEAVSAKNSARALAELARDLGASFAAVADETAYRELKEGLAGTRVEAAAGPSAMLEAALRPADWVMAAIAGSTGLKATLAAVDRGKTVALANKECLVCAGELFMQRARAAVPPCFRLTPNTMRFSRRCPRADPRTSRG